MDIGRRVRELREDLGMQRTVLARRVGVAENTIYRIETGKRTPSIELLEGIARELRTQPAELLREPSPSAEDLSALSRALRARDSAIMESLREVSAGMEDVQRTLLEAERLRETARLRVEEALASIAEAQASYRQQVAETKASVAEANASVAEAQASYREQVAHLQEVRRVMDQVYGSELELEWAFVKAMLEEGSSEGQQARRLRSANRKMILFYEELVGLIEDAGVEVKRKDEGEAVEEPKAPARLEALELTVH